MKTCSRCRISKPKTDFHIDRRPNREVSAYCKACNLKRVQEYRRKNREKIAAAGRENYKLNPARWERHLIRKYGITALEYERMLAEQKNQCAICCTYDPGGKAGKFFVDHCHDTGAVRGLLCTRCNQMLGYSLDSTETLIKAAMYLNAEAAKAFISAYMEVAA